ncbi:hypothetical protein PFICI_02074 [Pestalotiopsis fici W106-1]|uniref:Transcription factor CBF/NF-Y/archaeal histone domain-containing protein n=1 Tax=Pestalotiopsis fici (strain W106-1 / CGMCC3.15140) TaxID=1229662 RepID=W3XSS2_PESFW|nr:uncharacterized protein PFICI_02074 [Pestalotiopsis fici W106-1]ETS88246.1 hypothetical protein PFICI_02074 [Pestalotiopsis fici W106-1]
MSDPPQSPSKEVEAGVQSPDDEAQMNDPQDPHSGLGYEFEVKEQDRWLPIANGEQDSLLHLPSDLRALFVWCRCLAVSYGVPDDCCGQPRISTLSMSNDSSSQSPEAPRATSKAEKYDVYDANIRNFAPVARIMKLALPENAKIAKEAKECMQECVSEFISFITSEASEKCHQEKRKTVNGEDILFAMTSLGFENYSEALKIYLSKYREQSQSNRGENQQNRPGSQGYGAGAPGGSAAAGAPGFQGAESVEGGDGYMYSQGHNGSAGEGY